MAPESSRDHKKTIPSNSFTDLYQILNIIAFWKASTFNDSNTIFA